MGNCCAGQGESWIVGYKETRGGRIPLLGTKLGAKDVLDDLKARMSNFRKNFRIPAGLYGVGDPQAGSPVLVTANYKLTFDLVRRELGEVNAWLLVLDTDGINVWCAAGKGTFGTSELVARMAAVNLAKVVSHRQLIVPQLGAVGVAAHEVAQRTGFRVVYGPVRARDIRAFLADGCRTTAAMRRVKFSLADRLILVPIEIAHVLKPWLLALLVVALLGGWHGTTYDTMLMWQALPMNVVALGLVLFAGAVLTPALLPWLPTRSFAVKGAVAGGLAALAFAGWFTPAAPVALAWFLIITGAASMLGLGFTGASTYASPSGVRRELRLALPLQRTALYAGGVFWLLLRGLGV